jgi:hypothetical protein
MAEHRSRVQFLETALLIWETCQTKTRHTSLKACEKKQRFWDRPSTARAAETNLYSHTDPQADDNKRYGYYGG